jgi:hypothetical protein
MSTKFKLSSLNLLAILLLSLCFLSLNNALAQTSQADFKLQAANDALSRAFNVVLDAEKAGANVTDILTQFNYAAEVLAKAEDSYRVGNLDQAIIQSDSVFPITQQVTVSAQNAKQAALASSNNPFLFTAALKVIAAIIFILVLFLVWRRFKRGYVNNLSEVKPEVNSQ